MSVLRVYDPGECDERGVPLDWKRCRACGGRGHGPRADPWTCSICSGHGSLRAAALVEADRSPSLPDGGKLTRCSGCGHPASEGTWEGPAAEDPEACVEQTGVEHLAIEAGDRDVIAYNAVHFSPCDEGCRHGDPVRQVRIGPGFGPPGSIAPLDPLDPRGQTAGDVVRSLGDIHRTEASWRPVDVRTLGWPHDLRPEKLSVLCLRCWAAR